ncbi:MAG: UDP-N-acetylmuramoyl-tripeptide--D-alanyl-D-alanine ligase, partial [Bdellovibrionales bacterium]|nr:UDP-N-acetylmuramoyl-tripeptide--D-alanyl-D-alanine ligase [Bdellovibrionales bacterium]
MIAISLETLLKVTGGETLANKERLSFRGIEYDSRQIKGGELFVALKGETTHGHQFVRAALDQGAALCLVEEREIFAGQPESSRLVFVPDTLQAFWTLASYWRDKLGTPIAAVTGSVGKTTVKEIAACILLKHSRGAYSRKSFNNQVGVPYSLCALAPEHQWGVLELGMNHPGEIKLLSKIVKPDVAVVTAIAPAHMEFFNSLADIADAKLEILEGLRAGGTLVVNGDDPELVAGLSRSAESDFDLQRYGQKAGSDLQIKAVNQESEEAIEFALDGVVSIPDLRLNLLGGHN